ncbi:hypothetical protein SAE01_13220 [Segetibacter aerophilus]|uniref:Uncharacterized protein n=1 Tax=Segetibacter aerophilus TaxID=670293 RepID=A0A512BA32_9BACT|nr:hypothetical protein SAE01_13220 [Segetibacter aerophilus]
MQITILAQLMPPHVLLIIAENGWILNKSGFLSSKGSNCKRLKSGETKVEDLDYVAKG